MLRIALLLCLLQLSASIDNLALFLHREYEPKASQLCTQQNRAGWAFATDVENAAKAEELNRQSLAFSQFKKSQWEEHFKNVNTRNITDEKLRRQISFLSKLGISALNESELEELNEHKNIMATIYSSAKICPLENEECDPAEEGLPLDPDLEDIMASSRDFNELVYVWKAWRVATGAKMRDSFKKYIELSNEAAEINGFHDYGEMWRQRHEVWEDMNSQNENLKDAVMELWEQVEPLYLELHTYVREKLKPVYGEMVGNDGLISANLLGSMWAQSWVNIYDIVVPFPHEPLVNITSALIKQGYDAKKMFKVADEFYQSLGFPSSNMSYNESVAMIEKPTDGRTVVCHASAWDFCDKKDYRIKMCTNVNMKDFIIIHHEMGHIQYFIQYKDQPYALRGGANLAFHEAVGDAIALSVSTPQHLKKIGLLDSYEDSDNATINELLHTALHKVAFLPFGLIVDMWRWDVFSGETPESEWNSHWWELREQIQKVTAPVVRSEDDLDPAAKYHVAADFQYISYFLAHILQFQLHKALCIAAGQYKPDDSSSQPLHKCDIYNSKKAGKLLSDGLKLGSSQHWSKTLHQITGENKIDASALLEYFEPLYSFLKEENENNQEEREESEVQRKTASSKMVTDDRTIPIVVSAALIIVAVVIGVAFSVKRKARANRRGSTIA